MSVAASEFGPFANFFYLSKPFEPSAVLSASSPFVWQSLPLNLVNLIPTCDCAAVVWREAKKKTKTFHHRGFPGDSSA